MQDVRGKPHSNFGVGLKQANPKRVIMRKEEQYQVIDLGVSLAPGSLKRCRAKYAQVTQREAVERVVEGLEDGSVPLGDWGEGEIQIIGLHRVVTTPYWTIPVHTVLFPPREEGAEPVVGTFQAVEWNIGREVGAAVLLRTVRGEFVMLRSYKHAKRDWTIELPRGTRIPDETLKECAIREAQEEVGAVLTETSRVFPLGITDPDTGVVAMDPEIFMITDVIIDESKISRDVSESVLGPVVLRLPKLYDMVRSKQITDGFTSTALMYAQLEGLIDPPRVIPKRGRKTVKEFKVGWFGLGFHYELQAEVLEDSEVVLTLHLEDWVGSPPSFRGFLCEELDRIIRRLKRPSRRKDGFWSARLSVLHGHGFTLGGSGCFTSTLRFDFKEREDALKVAKMLDKIKAEQARIRKERRKARL